jgi:hypothetical protein
VWLKKYSHYPARTYGAKGIKARVCEANFESEWKFKLDITDERPDVTNERVGPYAAGLLTSQEESEGGVDMELAGNGVQQEEEGQQEEEQEEGEEQQDNGDEEQHVEEQHGEEERQNEEEQDEHQDEVQQQQQHQMEESDSDEDDEDEDEEDSVESSDEDEEEDDSLEGRSAACGSRRKALCELEYGTLVRVPWGKGKKKYSAHIICQSDKPHEKHTWVVQYQGRHIYRL